MKPLFLTRQERRDLHFSLRADLRKKQIKPVEITIAGVLVLAETVYGRPLIAFWWNSVVDALFEQKGGDLFGWKIEPPTDDPDWDMPEDRDPKPGERPWAWTAMPPSHITPPPRKKMLAVASRETGEFRERGSWHLLRELMDHILEEELEQRSSADNSLARFHRPITR